MSELLDEGRPLVVESDRTRIGQGPWARLFATAVVPDEGSTLAEAGRRLARSGAVSSVSVGVGSLPAEVEGFDVTLSAARVPPRIWAAMTSFSRNNRPLEAAIEGKEQSVHLEHLMTVDWEQPLIPRASDIARSCTCEDGARGIACAHVAAVGYVFADRIDQEPGLLLRWRGCVELAEVVEVDSPSAAVVAGEAGDPWSAGTPPGPVPLRPLPAGAVLKRLGPSGIRVGGNDLGEVLAKAYAAFGRS